MAGESLITLSWSLTVRAKDPTWRWRRSNQRIILDNVTGSVDGGTLLAVMGPSGTGKTTLLAAISKRLRGQEVSGYVLVNGRPASTALLSEICGFVPQKDIATESLTAREHLNFMAVMRLDASTSAVARERRIRVLLSDLGLTASTETRLGVLSGGERRRLAVAVQLLVPPRVLVLDEPCSGLDGSASLRVLGALQQEASLGRAVVCSVHQVSPEALTMFHQILVLGEGRVAFHGPTSDALSFLSRAGAGCPPGWPLTGTLHQMCAGVTDLHQVCDAFAQSSFALHHRVYPSSQEVLDRGSVQATNTKRVGWWTQLRWLCWRGALDTYRSMSEHLVREAVFFATAILLSLAFSKISVDTIAGVQSMSGLIFLICSEVYFTLAYCIFDTFPSELPVFLREAHLYSPSAFYFHKVVLLAPRAVLEPLIFVAIIQTQVDLTAGGGPWPFFAIFLTLLAVAWTASAYGFMLSAQFKTTNMVYLATMPIEFLTLLVGGIYTNVRSLPWFLNWLKYLSILYYGYETFSVIFWENVQSIDCSVTMGKPCTMDGSSVLHDYGFLKENFSRDLALLGLMGGTMHIIGLLGLWRRSQQPSTY